MSSLSLEEDVWAQSLTYELPPYSPHMAHAMLDDETWIIVGGEDPENNRDEMYQVCI